MPVHAITLGGTVSIVAPPQHLLSTFAAPSQILCSTFAAPSQTFRAHSPESFARLRSFPTCCVRSANGLRGYRALTNASASLFPQSLGRLRSFPTRLTLTRSPAWVPCSSIRSTLALLPVARVWRSFPARFTPFTCAGTDT